MRKALKIIAIGLAVSVLILGTTYGCIQYDKSRESNNSYSGCLSDTDVYVVLDMGTLDAARSSTCQVNGDGGNLPVSVTYECAKIEPGVGAGVMRVTWNETSILVSSSTCEPKG